MARAPKKKASSPTLRTRLVELEEKAAQKQIHIHYDLLEAAGLKLKDGLCRIRGEYHIFINRRKSDAERVETLADLLDHPLPEDVPETGPLTSSAAESAAALLPVSGSQGGTGVARAAAAGLPPAEPAVHDPDAESNGDSHNQ